MPILFWVAAASFLVIYKPVTAQMTSSRPLVSNGYSRAYLVYRPSHLPVRPSIVVMLGGTGSTAQSTSEEFRWQRQADQHEFIVVYPAPVATNPEKPIDRHSNPTFWDMKGSRTHLVAAGMLPVDDDAYLLAVLHDVLRREHANPKHVFFAGFSSGSGMVQLFASQHSREVAAIVAVATPLMQPPAKLDRPVPVLYIHGDLDEQFSGFEVNSPHFATTPHGNWVTWGHLDGCQIQVAEKLAWEVRFSWQQCKGNVPVIADFVSGLGHEWPGSVDSHWNEANSSDTRLDFTEMAWKFFSEVGRSSSK